MTTALGFIGTGTITHAIVTGLCNAPDPSPQIWVSPRSNRRARELAASYPNVHVASSNQEVLDRTDTVLLAVLPQIAQSVLEELVFKDSHHCISLVAGLSHESLLHLIRPATHWTRVTPTPAVGLRRGPIAMYPPDPETLALFSRIGEPVAVQQESEFEALVACSAEMAAFFELLQACMKFMMDCGVPVESARQYSASLFGALGNTALCRHELTFEQLAHEHTTPGGINEQLARELAEAGVFMAHKQCLERILARLIGSRRAADQDR
jgi:pyrroline-5-carboxylate reductase